MNRMIFFLLALIVGSAATAQTKRPVYVFAAASLGRVMADIVQNFDGKTVLDYGGSGVLARHVAAGAPADVVVLANPVWMNWLTDQGIAAAQDVQFVASNSLVVIGQSGAEPLANVTDLPARLGTERLGMGQRDAVPAGTYARQWLQSVGLWAALSDKLAETDNVTATLVLVSRAQLPYGVVYASDAKARDNVEVIYAVPAHSHDTILYPAVALTPNGAAFLDHLMSPQSADTFVRHGFQRVPQ